MTFTWLLGVLRLLLTLLLHLKHLSRLLLFGAYVRPPGLRKCWGKGLKNSVRFFIIFNSSVYIPFTLQMVGFVVSYTPCTLALWTSNGVLRLYVLVLRLVTVFWIVLLVLAILLTVVGIVVPNPVIVSIVSGRILIIIISVIATVIPVVRIILIIVRVTIFTCIVILVTCTLVRYTRTLNSGKHIHKPCKIINGFL